MSLPFAAVERIVKNAPGVNRSSESAIKIISSRAEEYITDIAAAAAKSAQHAGRVTIRADDVEFSESFLGQ